jgi:hypothetical protein
MAAEHHVGRTFVQDERSVGKVGERGVVETLLARHRIDPLGMELRVNRVGADLAGMKFAPRRVEADVVLAAAEGARSMPCREGRGLIEEEQVGEAPGLQQRSSKPSAELEAARDPALAVVVTSDPAVLVVQAAAVPVDETPTRL